MYPISALYEEYLQRRSREWLIKVDIAGTEYGSNVIVDFVVDNSLSGGQEFELGTSILSKLTLRLKTTDTIPVNARVVPYVALQLPASLDGANVAWQDADIAWQDADFPWGGNVTEWLPLGEFFVDKREQVKDIWTFTCYDKLYLADVPYVSQLTYPTSMRAVWDEICNRVGYAYDNSIVIDPSYQIQAGPAGYTMRQVLGYIASANAACVYISKDGILRFRRFSGTDQPVAELTTADYIRVKQTNPTKTYTKVVVVYNTEDQLAYEAGTGDENATLYVENPFATPAITNALLARLNGFTYTPVDMDARGYPQIEVGDRLRYGVRSAQYDITWQGADVAWQDADWAWDGFEAGSGAITLALKQTYTFKGGLRLGITAPSKSVQETEFPVEGSLSGQINRLNKTAVREGRSYFGMTITRTDGLVIEREDHLSRVVLNSDEFRFTADGEDALWFDLPSRRFKFAGTLEAAGGTFTGDLQAAGGTFAGNLSAAGGTFTGDLSAAGGTFTGTLQGVDGDFSGTVQGGAFVGGTITIGTGNNVFKADSNGIYLGNSAFGSAPFRVNMQGQLTASNATITGTINATGGVFSGDIEVDGTLSGGTIEGAFIEGGFIVGPYIMTSVGTYPRIELSSAGNLLAAYYESNTYLAIDPDLFGGPTIAMYDDGSLDGMFGYIPSLGILLQASNGSLTLRGGNNLFLTTFSGFVTVDSWDDFYSQSDGKTLGEELSDIWQTIALMGT